MSALLRAVSVVCLLLVFSSSAFADARAEATVLFDEGIKEMKAGNFEKACKAFEGSVARYPDSGTKGSLAKCYEKLGKLASAWLLWRELADTAPKADLRKDAEAQAAKLDKRVPKYTLKAAPTPGLAITINGTTAGTSDVPVPIDPGKVVVAASATGYQPWQTELAAAEGKTLPIEVPALVAAPTTGGGDDIKPPPGKTVTDDSRRKKRRIISASVTIAGIAAVTVGGVFGLSASSKFDDAKETCGGSIDNCNPANLAAAQTQVDDARSAANLSSILMGAGGALVVTGIVLWVTAPSPEQRPATVIRPVVQPNAAGLVLSGRF